jgi:hypothetical protein
VNLMGKATVIDRQSDTRDGDVEDVSSERARTMKIATSAGLNFSVGARGVSGNKSGILCTAPMVASMDTSIVHIF